MQASAKPEFSVNIVTNLTTPAGRETAAPLPMRMTVTKLNFFYGPKQILFDINMRIADKRVKRFPCRYRGKELEARRAVGGSEGSSSQVGVRALRRAAAAALHRAGSGG